ncbi:MAG: hypothetical protein GF399_13025 [Candidatus Coatesbacteria bacterium]|nr:hypothetical protein [Candidatus Coatesbacteria bacterium]
MRYIPLLLCLLVPLAAWAQDDNDDGEADPEAEEETEQVVEEEPTVIGAVIGLDDASDVCLQITNTAEYKLYEGIFDAVEGEKIYGMQTFEDDLTANINVGNLVLGGTLRFWQPRYDDVLDYTREYKSELFKWYVGYAGENVEGRYGTFYTTFGRGLTLHLYDDPIFYDVDTFLEGFYGHVNLDYVEVKALVGRGSYDFDALYEYTDDVRAVEVNVNPFFNWIELGGGLVSQEQQVGVDFISGEPISKPLLMPAGHLSVITDYADLYVEYAVSEGYELAGAEYETYEGEAIYASLVGYLGRNSLLLEYKKYDHFYNHWNSPPEVSFSTKPLDKSYPGKDEEGYLAQLTVSPLVGLSVVGGYCDAWDTEEEKTRTEYGGEVRWSNWPWHFVGGAWLHGESTEYFTPDDPSYFLYERDEWLPELEASYTFDFGHSLALHYTHQLITERTVQGDYYDETLEEQNPQGSLTYNWPELFSATIGGQVALGDLRVGEDRDYWITGEVTFHLGPNHDLSIFYGNERGGLVCSGGVCREEPPFDGLRIKLESRI